MYRSLHITLFVFFLASGLFAQNSESDFWEFRYSDFAIQNPSADIIQKEDGFRIKSKLIEGKNTFVYALKTLKKPINSISFDYHSEKNAAEVPIILMDAAANELWRSDRQTDKPLKVELKNLQAHGQLIFKIGSRARASSTAEVTHSISDIKFQESKQKRTKDSDGFIVIDNLTDLMSYAYQDNVKVRLKPGHYQLNKAFCKQFIEFRGNNSVYDLRGANILVDTKLFSRTDLSAGINDGHMYCAIAIHGNNVEMIGPYVETYGDTPGIQSRNKIFNLTGKDVTLRDAEVRTSGSSPWGYGSFYGLGGGDVRKMNGIRIAKPGDNIRVIGCKVHMRAMGHAIFVQGAKNTLIEDCHVDGLLRTTDDILKETSGYAFEKDFKASRGNYVEGAVVAEDGSFLPGEMFSLSEDGIRIYPENDGILTGTTTIKNCTVANMRRGICTGLNSIGDKVINCKVTNTIAAGFNVGNEDTLVNCKADAKYAEAFTITKANAQNASVDIEILDSRKRMKNDLLAGLNGKGHKILIKTSNPSFVPSSLAIELATLNGYAFYQRSEVTASDIQLKNQTEAKVILLPGAGESEIESKGEIVDRAN